MQEKLGEYITFLRTERGLSLQKLANAASIPRTTLRDIEAGRVQNPRMDTLDAIARVLGTTLDEITQRQPTQPQRTDQVAQLVTKWGHLRERQRKLVMGIIDLLLEED